MTRKKLINALSIIFIISGLWDIVLFFYSAVISAGHLEINRLIWGALAPYIGFHLFKLDEFARKSVVVLLFVRVSVNLYLLVRLLFRKEGVVSSGLYFLDKEIHRFANPYAPKVFLAASIIVVLLTIGFLSQRETKKIFVPATSSESNGVVEPL
ncbi:MAG: hypothetical protein CVU39_18735 [Chloroflexi bacterium HGW-Chloroflexi-10]|nr:MAG: hypothetical protein CVU39_18735 [Chloroflexi bacterium HGW-Chloroflexi-10]